MKRLADIAILLTLLVVCSLFICKQAMQVFDFFDMAAFMDAGYRVWRGQKIYVDFFYIAGPVHPYLWAFFFALFGFNKTAILAYLCATQAVCLTAVFFMARRTLSIALSAGLTALTCASLFGPIVHPWYDQTAIAFFLIASAAMFWSYPISSAWRTLVLPAISGGCIALSFLTKTNIGAAAGGMMFLGYLAISLTSRNNRPVIAYVVASLIVLAAVVLALPSKAAYIYQNFAAFNVGGRLFDFGKLEKICVYHPYLPMALAGAFIIGIGGWNWCQKHIVEISLFVITWVTGVFSAWTGSAIAESYCFFWGLIALWLVVLASALPKGVPATYERRISQSIKVVIWSSFSLMFLFLWSRQLMTWAWQAGNLDGNYTMRCQAMEGWKCRADIGRGLDQAVAYINQNVPVNDSLFIAPDCQIIYGLTNHDSYRKVPFGFNTDNSPGIGDMRTQMLKHFQEEPPKWILLRDEEIQNPLRTWKLLGELGLIGTLQSDYQPVSGAHWDEFQLFKHR